MGSPVAETVKYAAMAPSQSATIAAAEPMAAMSVITIQSRNVVAQTELQVHANAWQGRSELGRTASRPVDVAEAVQMCLPK